MPKPSRSRNASTPRLPKNLWCTAQQPSAKATPLPAVAQYLDSLAPPRLAESWDNVGLLSGPPTAFVQKILLTIDITPAVHDEAIANNIDLILSYHPPIFKPLKSLRIDDQEAPALAISLASRGIWVYSPHTALDTVSPGTNDILAQTVGTTITGSFASTAGEGTYLKLVTFIPENAVEEVADALFAAGCGHIGTKSKYTRCSFRTPGTGTFQGDEATNPAVGQRGVYERVQEIRFETILPAHRASDVVAALMAAHPYEEPAFDLLKMETPPQPISLGRYAQLPQPLTVKAFANRCQKTLHVPHAQIVIPPSWPASRKIQSLALIAGSAGKYALQHARQPYDLLLTGELKHHDMLAYTAHNIACICLGHGNTERPVLAYLQKQLTRQFPQLAVQQAKTDRDPFITN